MESRIAETISSMVKSLSAGNLALQGMESTAEKIVRAKSSSELRAPPPMREEPAAVKRAAPPPAKKGAAAAAMVPPAAMMGAFGLPTNLFAAAAMGAAVPQAAARLFDPAAVEKRK